MRRAVRASLTGPRGKWPELFQPAPCTQARPTSISWISFNLQMQGQQNDPDESGLPWVEAKSVLNGACHQDFCDYYAVMTDQYITPRLLSHCNWDIWSLANSSLLHPDSYHCIQWTCHSGLVSESLFSAPVTFTFTLSPFIFTWTLTSPRTTFPPNTCLRKIFFLSVISS